MLTSLEEFDNVGADTVGASATPMPSLPPQAALPTLVCLR